MGLTADQDGFARVDSLVEWCRESDLYLILDMHDAPADRRATTSTTATAILAVRQRSQPATLL